VRFALVDDLVYRKVEDSVRFVVPETMVHNIIKIYYDDMAHCDTRKTLKGIAKGNIIGFYTYGDAYRNVLTIVLSA